MLMQLFVHGIQGHVEEKQLQKQYLVKIHHLAACQLHFMRTQKNFQISVITV